MKISIKANLENIVTNLDGSITFYFRQDNAELTNTNKLITDIKQCQEHAKNGLKIDICEYREQRSLDANAYFHILVDKIANATNKGADEVKIEMNLEYGTIMRDDKGLKVGIKLPKSVNVRDIYEYAKWFDCRTENGKEFNCYIIYKPTRTLDTKEMSRLIDGTIQEAQNLDIETKTPEQIAEMMALWENKNGKT